MKLSTLLCSIWLRSERHAENCQLLPWWDHPHLSRATNRCPMQHRRLTSIRNHIVVVPRVPAAIVQSVLRGLVQDRRSVVSAAAPPPKCHSRSSWLGQHQRATTHQLLWRGSNKQKKIRRHKQIVQMPTASHPLRYICPALLAQPAKASMHQKSIEL